MRQDPLGPAACRNCGNPAGSNFCPECGQATHLHPPSALEFVHEIASHYVAAEGKLWRTLALLTLKPGRLTTEYLAGRRQRYIVPFRLYLTASFLFFVSLQLSGPDRVRIVTVSGDGDVQVVASPPAEHRSDPGHEQDAAIEALKNPRVIRELEAEGFADCMRPAAHCPLWKRWSAPAFVKLQRDPGHFIERFSERWRHSLSYAMFCLLPIFAALLALAYRKRRMYYGEHLVFSLHVHSFWFLLGVLTTVLLPDSAGGLFPAIAFGYGMWALQRVYGGRLWATVLRGLVVTTVYSLIIGIGAALLSIALLAT
ncbi:MAG TPA: DUF3667 domain-containing protein [Burkholderiaceae bacterium]